jgi:hypothetical protein
MMPSSLQSPTPQASPYLPPEISTQTLRQVPSRRPAWSSFPLTPLRFPTSPHPSPFSLVPEGLNASYPSNWTPNATIAGALATSPPTAPPNTPSAPTARCSTQKRTTDARIPPALKRASRRLSEAVAWPPPYPVSTARVPTQPETERAPHALPLRPALVTDDILNEWRRWDLIPFASPATSSLIPTQKGWTYKWVPKGAKLARPPHRASRLLWILLRQGNPLLYSWNPWHPRAPRQGMALRQPSRSLAYPYFH